MITELLPNPASPQTDANDEYVELYNPNAVPFNLDGYSLEVGTSTVRTYSFDEDAVIPTETYKAFFSSETGLSLTNSGGQVRLRDAEGVIVSETTVYGAAGDNQAWTLSEGVWKWTSTPTPGAANILTAVAAAKAATKAAAAKKAATPKAAKAPKAKVATAKKAKAKKPAKKKVKKAQAASLVSSTAAKPKPPIHTGILVAVAVAALLYGLYEYRHDISNKIHQLRANRATRRGAGNQTAWRRGYSAE